jgi:hypothetical protein
LTPSDVPVTQRADHPYVGITEIHLQHRASVGSPGTGSVRMTYPPVDTSTGPHFQSAGHRPVPDAQTHVSARCSDTCPASSSDRHRGALAPSAPRCSQVTNHRSPSTDLDPDRTAVSDFEGSRTPCLARRTSSVGVRDTRADYRPVLRSRSATFPAAPIALVVTYVLGRATRSTEGSSFGSSFLSLPADRLRGGADYDADT